jgi:hypothetical protein
MFSVDNCFTEFKLRLGWKEGVKRRQEVGRNCPRGWEDGRDQVKFLTMVLGKDEGITGAEPGMIPLLQTPNFHL